VVRGTPIADLSVITEGRWRVIGSPDIVADVSPTDHADAGSFGSDPTVALAEHAVGHSQSELSRLIAHELAHILVRRRVERRLPTWLSEGLAVVLGAPIECGADLRLRDLGRGVAREQLRQLPERAPALLGPTLSYDVYGSFGHFLISRADSEVSGFLNSVAEMDIDSAVRHRTGRNLGTALREWRSLLSAGTLPPVPDRGCEAQGVFTPVAAVASPRRPANRTKSRSAAH
jgi:hypothetical protein